MNNKYLGQAMAEYLVVVTALVSTMFWGANATCPNPNSSLGYTNCIQNLLTTMHDKYEGYSNSMTAVHRYGEPRGDVFVSQWVETSSGGSGLSAGSGPSSSSDGNVIFDIAQWIPPLSRAEPGSLIGTRLVVVDSEGNVVPPQAVVDCDDRSSVLGFGYEDPSTGEFYDSVSLRPYSTIPPCLEPTYRIVDVDGIPTSGVIVGNKYYNPILTSEVVGNTVIQPRGEVINFLGEPLDCAVLIDPTSFAPMPQLQSVADFSDDRLREWYNGINPETSIDDADANRKGSLDPSQNVPCPAGSRQVGPPSSVPPF